MRVFRMIGVAALIGVKGQPWRRGLGLNQVIRNRVHHIGERHIKGSADRCKQLARRLFLTSLDLREVTERDCGSGRYIAKRATLILTTTPKFVTDHMPKNDHGRTSLMDSLYTVSRWPDMRHIGSEI